jgi:cytochrome c-type biogenesis protein CcmH/NrfG
MTNSVRRGVLVSIGLLACMFVPMSVASAEVAPTVDQSAATPKARPGSVQPKSAAEYKALTETYLRQSDWARAFGAAEEAMKLSPNDAAWHFKIASMFLQWDKDKSALPHLKAAYTLNPSNSDYAIAYAGCLVRLKNKVGAAEVLQNSTQRKPKDSAAWMSLASIYLLMDDLSGADDAAGKALQLDPGSYDAQFLAAKTKLKQLSFEDARALTKRLLETEPARPEGYLLAAHCSSWNTNRPQDAADMLAKAEKFLPRDARLFSELGNLFQTKALQYNPRRSPANGPRQAKWNALAERCYRKAVAIDPQKIEYLLDLAGFLATERRDMEANAVLARAAKLDPHNQLVLYGQQKMKYVSNDLAGAFKHWLKSRSAGL